MSKLIISLLTGIPILLYEGWVLTNIWQWFVVEKFGVVGINTLEAAGLFWLISLLTLGVGDLAAAKSEEADVFDMQLATIIVFTLGLLVTAILHLFL
jgi:succinate-acetate transporter protein